MNIMIMGVDGGLGKSLLDKYQNNGHKIFATSYTDMATTYENTKIIKFNVSEDNENLLYTEVSNYMPHIDIFINTIGILYDSDREGNIFDLTKKEYLDNFNVNCLSNIFILKELKPLFNEYAKIILITSEAGSLTNSGSNFPAYSISKTAQNKVAFILSKTFKDTMQVLAIHPGRMKTSMNKFGEITPLESARKIYEISLNDKKYKNLFINYKGEEMEV